MHQITEMEEAHKQEVGQLTEELQNKERYIEQLKGQLE